MHRLDFLTMMMMLADVRSRALAYPDVYIHSFLRPMTAEDTNA